MVKYEIEKDIILNKYIVWEVHRNYMVEKFRGNKKQCKEYINDKK